MSEDLIESYAHRLGAYEIDTIKKSNELYRLIKLQNFRNINDVAKVVFSIECASNLCGTEFNYPEVAFQLAGLKKTEYQRQKNVFEKLLNLNKSLKLKDICLQLELNDAIKTNAQCLLDAYKKHPTFTDDINSAHCITMAIYQSCKLKKIKMSKLKTKLIALSNLNVAKWKRIEEQWHKWITAEDPLKGNLLTTNYNPESNSITEKSTSTKIERTEDIVKSYEDWRDEIITNAMAELKKQHLPNDDENSVT